MTGRIRILIAVAVVAALGVGAWFYLTRGQRVHRRRAGGRARHAGGRAHRRHRAARAGRRQPGRSRRAPSSWRSTRANTRSRSIGRAPSWPTPRPRRSPPTPTCRSRPRPRAAACRRRASGVEQAQAFADEAQHNLDGGRGAPRRRCAPRSSGEEAAAARDERDVARLKGLLAKDEVSQQQYDAAVAQLESSRADVAVARSQVREAEVAIQVRAQPAGAVEGRRSRWPSAELRTAETAPEQVAATKARAQSSAARVKQAQAAVGRAELDLEHAVGEGADQGRGQPQVGRARAGHPAGTAADDDHSARAGVDHRQLQGNPARRHARGAARSRSTSTPTAGASSRARWKASPPPPDRASACCRPRTPPATSSRWCSGCR